jgi:Dynein heavy chain, N-terminal region 2
VVLDAQKIQAEVDEYLQKASQLSKLDKEGREHRVVSLLKDCLEEFQAIMPMVIAVANPALRPHHWEAIFQAMNLTEV